MGPLLDSITKNIKVLKILARVVLKAIEAKKSKSVYKSNQNLGVKIMSYLPQKIVTLAYTQYLSKVKILYLLLSKNGFRKEGRMLFLLTKRNLPWL